MVQKKTTISDTTLSESTLGKLFVVATPIGNLGDMTYRAVETLKSVDTILCEDTRTTGKLLAHYEIKNKTMSFHSHSKLAKVDKIIDMIRCGQNLALVSDAGTPCISDPGVMLVSELRKALGDALIISPIPGASALISALSVAGVPVHEFTFLGFIPHKKGRETLFNEIATIHHTVVCYESVHRIMKTLDSLHQVMPERTITLARELTKMFETIQTGTAQFLRESFDNNPESLRGEFVIIVHPIKS
mgnify:CR=1 FL=1